MIYNGKMTELHVGLFLFDTNNVVPDSDILDVQTMPTRIKLSGSPVDITREIRHMVANLNQKTLDYYLFCINPATQIYELKQWYNGGTIGSNDPLYETAYSVMGIAMRGKMVNPLKPSKEEMDLQRIIVEADGAEYDDNLIAMEDLLEYFDITADNINDDYNLSRSQEEWVPVPVKNTKQKFAKSPDFASVWFGCVWKF